MLVPSSHRAGLFFLLTSPSPPSPIHLTPIATCARQACPRVARQFGGWAFAWLNARMCAPGRPTPTLRRAHHLRPFHRAIDPTHCRPCLPTRAKLTMTVMGPLVTKLGEARVFKLLSLLACLSRNRGACSLERSCVGMFGCRRCKTTPQLVPNNP